MKLSSIYTNKPKLFPRINFNEGFNIIFAKVKDPAKKEKDSHNLGKTFLIRVIDFLLLEDIDKDHPFRQKPDLFNSFVFFLELQTHSGKYVTVRRYVDAEAKIGIKVSEKHVEDLGELPEEQWNFRGLSLTKARVALNDLLDLKVLGSYPYRKGLGYVLRSQADYDEVFRISKFRFGRDEYWKPFLAQILGFNAELITKKYKLEEKLKGKQDEFAHFESEAGSKSGEYDELKGLVELATASAERLEKRLDEFSFREIEAEINETLVSDIEADLSKLSRRRYTIDYELKEIEKSLQTELEFDLVKIQEIFNEVQVELPAALVRSYEELVEFNERISSGRTKRLQELGEQLLKERQGIEETIQSLDERRAEALAVLQERKTFEKFKKHQKELVKKEGEVIELKHRLSQLDKASAMQQDISSLQQEISEVSKQILELVRGENSTFRQIRTTFSEYVESILNVQALLSVAVNQNGNLEFNVRTLDKRIAGRETDEGQGTSYKKVLCVCFDLALISVYAPQPFYHFAYHDGIFEGLDNRKKVNLVNLLRRLCKDKNIQHILTVIDSDLPRDERDQKLLFDGKDIIRQLHDDGNSGRLFRMTAF